jgi:hypothetical protein
MTSVGSPLGGREFHPDHVSGALRPVLSAWLVAILLLGALLTSLTLDHLVTVSADPPAAYSAARDALVNEEVEPRATTADEAEAAPAAGN